MPDVREQAEARPDAAGGQMRRLLVVDSARFVPSLAVLTRLQAALDRGDEVVALPEGVEVRLVAGAK